MKRGDLVRVVNRTNSYEFFHYRMESPEGVEFNVFYFEDMPGDNDMFGLFTDALTPYTAYVHSPEYCFMIEDLDIVASWV